MPCTRPVSNARRHTILGDLALAWRELDATRGVAPYAHGFGVTHLVAAGRFSEAASLVVDFEAQMARRRVRVDDEDLSRWVLDCAAVAKCAPSRATRCWADFARGCRHLFGREGWEGWRVLFQAAMDHADDSAVTMAAEAFEESGQRDWAWLRWVNRPEAWVPSPLQVTFAGHRGAVSDVVVVNDQLLASRGDDGTVRIWQARTGRCEVVIEAHAHPVSGMLATRGRQLVTWSDLEDRFLCWSLEGELLHSLDYGAVPPSGALVTPHDGLVSWGHGEDGRELVFWHPPGEAVRRRHERGAIRGAVVDHDDAVVTWSDDGMLLGWSPEGDLRWSLEVGAPIARVIVLDDGTLAILPVGARTVVLWRHGVESARLDHDDMVLGIEKSSPMSLVSWTCRTVTSWSNEGEFLAEANTRCSLDVGSDFDIDDVYVASVPPPARRGMGDVVLVTSITSCEALLVRFDPLHHRVTKFVSLGLLHRATVLKFEGSPLTTSVVGSSTVVAATEDGRLQAFLFDGTPMQYLAGHVGPIVGLRVVWRQAPSSRRKRRGRSLPPVETLITWSVDGTFRTWTIDADSLVDLVAPPTQRSSEIGAIVALGGKDLLVVSHDGAEAILSRRDGYTEHLLGRDVRDVRSVGGGIYTVHRDGELRRWSATGELLGELRNLVLQAPCQDSWSASPLRRAWGGADGLAFFEVGTSMLGFVDDLPDEVPLPDAELLGVGLSKAGWLVLHYLDRLVLAGKHETSTFEWTSHRRGAIAHVNMIVPQAGRRTWVEAVAESGEWRRWAPSGEGVSFLSLLADGRAVTVTAEWVRDMPLTPTGGSTTPITPTSMALASESVLVGTSGLGAVVWWPLVEGQAIVSQPIVGDHLRSSAWESESLVAAPLDADTVFVWIAKTRSFDEDPFAVAVVHRQHGVLGVLRCHQAPVVAVVGVSPDRAVSLGEDGVIVAWHLPEFRAAASVDVARLDVDWAPLGEEGYRVRRAPDGHFEVSDGHTSLRLEPPRKVDATACTLPSGLSLAVHDAGLGVFAPVSDPEVPTPLAVLSRGEHALGALQLSADEVGVWTLADVVEVWRFHVEWAASPPPPAAASDAIEWFEPVEAVRRVELPTPPALGRLFLQPTARLLGEVAGQIVVGVGNQLRRTKVKGALHQQGADRRPGVRMRP